MIGKRCGDFIGVIAHLKNKLLSQRVDSLPWWIAIKRKKNNIFFIILKSVEIEATCTALLLQQKAQSMINADLRLKDKPK